MEEEIYPPIPSRPPTNDRRNRTMAAVSAGAVGLCLVGAGVLIGSLIPRHDGSGTKGSASPAPTRVRTAVKAPSPSPTYVTPGPDDFELTLKTTSRHCFGSAGCNIEVEPVLSYEGDTDSLNPDSSYSITYEIHGDESGPVVDTLDLSDRTSISYEASDVTTSSSSVKLTVRIVSVTEH